MFGMVGTDNYLIPDEQQVSVFDFDLIDGIFRDAATYSNSYYVPSLRAVIGRTILEMDPPDHQRYRSLLQAAFTKREMVRWERDFVRDIVASRLERLAPLGKGDLAADFAFHYPITVTAVAAGLPVEDVPTFYKQAALLTNVAVDEARRLQASEDLGAMVLSLIEERRAEPADDLISILVHAELPGVDGAAPERLTDDEIVAFLRLLVPAGAQTTYRTLTNLLFALLTHPDQLDALYRDRSLIPSAVERAAMEALPRSRTPPSHRLRTRAAGTTRTCASLGQPRPRAGGARLVRYPPQDHAARAGQGNHIHLHHFARRLGVALKDPDRRSACGSTDADDVHIGGLMSRTAVHLPCLWDVPGTSDNTKEEIA
jgi:cytochrome P450